MSDLPTLVFTPGAWHRPICYSKVMKALQERHHIKCTSFSLPSTSGDPNATFKDDLDVARSAIRSETSQGRDVILIAHSYGGMIANSAIKGFNEHHESTRDISQPRHGRIIGLVLIASGFTLTGLSFMDPLFHIPPPTWRANEATGFADIVTPPAQLFYHDLPTEEAAEWVAQLTPQSLKALFEGVFAVVDAIKRLQKVQFEDCHVQQLLQQTPLLKVGDQNTSEDPGASYLQDLYDFLVNLVARYQKEIDGISMIERTVIRVGIESAEDPDRKFTLTQQELAINSDTAGLVHNDLEPRNILVRCVQSKDDASDLEPHIMPFTFEFGREDEGLGSSSVH
ncbi:hypothetical protein E8E12_003121 [Didymella heteroderae]|uniref:AB hydrolase-1 domain-containing protein n=1 Tax=Didymella heteroderae TaxID=1769908 RepID=A0A9P4WTZ7_9PLEO|nr:hypothetical protein E8E12_003121 [Didymella heteroderae]